MAKEGLLVWASCSNNNARNDIYLPSPLGQGREGKEEKKGERGRRRERFYTDFAWLGKSTVIKY